MWRGCREAADQWRWAGKNRGPSVTSHHVAEAGDAKKSRGHLLMEGLGQEGGAGEEEGTRRGRWWWKERKGYSHDAIGLIACGYAIFGSESDRIRYRTVTVSAHLLSILIWGSLLISFGAPPIPNIVPFLILSTLPHTVSISEIVYRTFIICDSDKQRTLWDERDFGGGWARRKDEWWFWCDYQHGTEKRLGSGVEL
ncbi:hypothetical protein D9758_014211 [Tetrapyrgos nigripes]|uniref:Uncharacterized protein n=1 Tax=Tetrapyrgos nigripes TaxID=182062 RepID=A0A8H5FUA0_9AGAR|nr:hypothetical protein D9758_014211 [Tetrapyrgos nigripes]